MTLRPIDPTTLHARLRSGGELALLDVREEGVFGARHILAASNAPLSRLERIVPPLVPRRAAPVVLVDDDGTLAARAAPVLAAAGYGDVAVLAGGVPAWAAAGFELFAGVYVPSKAFGEFVELHYGTPHIDARDFAARREAGERIVLLDSRPFDEFSWITIPGAIDCPGGELVYRARAVVGDDDTLVVVACGGRTRSIIGAQVLIDAGLPNRVVSLRNGTQGWHLAGLAVQRGATAVAPAPEDGHPWARDAARRLAERYGVRTLDAAGLAAFEVEAGERTLYRFDVRDGAEYRAGHRRGFLSAPGGQLVQATDTFVAVRRGRIVLADSDGVRARTAAAWLRRMGFDDVFVLDDEPAPRAAIETGDAPETVLGLAAAPEATLAPADLAPLLAAGKVVVVDVATSRKYRAGHIPGAWFAVRGRLAADAAALPPAPRYVLTSGDGVIARLAAAELAAATGAEVAVLAGGTAAWTAAGHALETDAERMASTPDDVLLKAFERRDGQEDAMREYLQWELDLVEQVRRDGTIAFRL